MTTLKKLFYGLLFLPIFSTISPSSSSAFYANPSYEKTIEISINGEQRSYLPLYPVEEKVKHGKMQTKYYTEAISGENYSITVRNVTNRRIGVVVAVDGRNIVSGKKSYLKSNERMYVIPPYDSVSLNGWRTSNQIERKFFFTEQEKSYAAAFDDTSAMGVIAISAFDENVPIIRRHEQEQFHSDKKKTMKAPSAAMESNAVADQAFSGAARSAPGTGYGDEHHSSVVEVEFKPLKESRETVLVKYEWRETLCKKNIISCKHGHREKPNRLWNDNDGYAPPPPR